MKYNIRLTKIIKIVKKDFILDLCKGSKLKKKIVFTKPN